MRTINRIGNRARDAAGPGWGCRRANIGERLRVGRQRAIKWIGSKIRASVIERFGHQNLLKLLDEVQILDLPVELPEAATQCRTVVQAIDEAEPRRDVDRLVGTVGGQEGAEPD